MWKIFTLSAVVLAAIIFGVILPWKENAPQRAQQDAMEQKVAQLQREIARTEYDLKYPKSVSITVPTEGWSEWVYLVNSRDQWDLNMEIVKTGDENGPMDFSLQKGLDFNGQPKGFGQIESSVDGEDIIIPSYTEIDYVRIKSDNGKPFEVIFRFDNR